MRNLHNNLYLKIYGLFALPRYRGILYRRIAPDIFIMQAVGLYFSRCRLMRRIPTLCMLLLVAMGLAGISPSFAQATPSPDTAGDVCLGAICIGTAGVVIIVALVIFAILAIALMLFLLKKERL